MATRDKYPLNAAGIPLITAYNGSFCLFGGKVGGCVLYTHVFVSRCFLNLTGWRCLSLYRWKFSEIRLIRFFCFFDN